MLFWDLREIIIIKDKNIVPIHIYCIGIKLCLPYQLILNYLNFKTMILKKINSNSIKCVVKKICHTLDFQYEFKNVNITLFLIYLYNLTIQEFFFIHM